jgi:hypothetical protein
MSDKESVRDTIAPKSDQLNADDLLAGPQTVTIVKWSRGSDEKQPLDLYVAGRKVPYRPCKSMRRVMVAAWGEYPQDWVGKSLTMFCDPEVVFGGVKVGGIRISHISDIPNDLSVLLTATKGKRHPYTVRRLDAAIYPPALFAENLPKMRDAVKKGTALDKIVAHAEKTGKLTADQLSAITANDEETF